jgi:hypothetical protein
MNGKRQKPVTEDYTKNFEIFKTRCPNSPQAGVTE